MKGCNMYLSVYNVYKNVYVPKIKYVHKILGVLLPSRVMNPPKKHKHPHTDLFYVTSMLHVLCNYSKSQ